MLHSGRNFYYSFVKKGGHKIKWERFRVYLKEKYKIDKAYYFVGYFEDNIKLYTELQEAGFVLIFKPVTIQDGIVKGNVDGDLISFASRTYKNFKESSLITNDGDYHRLVEFIEKDERLQAVFSLNKKFCSWLLRKKAGKKIIFLENSMHLFCDQKKKDPQGISPIGDSFI